MKKLCSFLLLLLLPFWSFSDDRELKNPSNSPLRSISGKITDSYGESLPAARILIVETGEEFFANFEGRFNISLPADKGLHLKLESMGYQPLEISASELENLSELQLRSL